MSISVFVFLVFFSIAANASEKESKEGELPVWMERVSLTGTIEGDYSWSEHNDVADKASDSTSDLYISTVELGIEAEITNWITGGVVLKTENIGLDGGGEAVLIDEATISLQKDSFPVYVVVGKRGQPFGVFESHLITDPITQDAYETVRPGITVGIAGPIDLDLSATIYKGEEMMDHLVEAELSSAISRTSHTATDEVNSYILSVSVTPFPEQLTLFGSYISEPGYIDRNSTLSFGVNSQPVDGLIIDAEYFMALQREKYDGQTKEFRERVLSASVAYQLIDPLVEIAVRYEHFDDDGMAEGAGIWAVDNRYSAGAGYSFYYDEESGLAAYIAAEYRLTNYRETTDSIDKNNEFFARLGLSF